MAESDKDKDKAAAIEGRSNTESPAERQGNTGEVDPAKETPPVPDKDTPKKPDAAGNAEDVLGPSDSFPNTMSTAGLTPAQRARVEGTPLDGALGANVKNAAIVAAATPQAGTLTSERAREISKQQAEGKGRSGK